MYLKKNDTVIVISGESKGSQGRIVAVFPKNNRVLVEGVNMVSKHTRPTKENQQGGIIKKEAPLHVSKLMLLDPESGTRTRVKKEREGKKVKRVAKKSNKPI